MNIQNIKFMLTQVVFYGSEGLCNINHPLFMDEQIKEICCSRVVHIPGELSRGFEYKGFPIAILDALSYYIYIYI